MKLPLAFLAAYLALSTFALAAPIGADVSLTDSIRSFESAYSELDDKFQDTIKKQESFSRKEKIITGLAAGASTLATGGFVASAAIPRYYNREKEDNIRRLHEAALASERSQSNIAKRAGIPLGAAEEAESFVSALSRSNSDRYADFDDKAKSVHLVSDKGEPFLPAPRLQQDFHYDNSAPFSPGNFRPNTPSPGETVPERLGAVEQALLEMKKHQHDSAKLSPFTKALIGVGVVNAAATVAAAELNVQNSIEAGKSRKGEEEQTQVEEDVKKLDKKTCEEWKEKEGLQDLDCSEAHE